MSPRKKVAPARRAAIDFERLGAFYIGKEYDLAKGRVLDRLTMFDARDLTTHALCVGMTGSGKTGLCISLLEEAAIDQVPAIIIDPKGDITNLLLTFPKMRPEDFRQWINEDDARRKALSPDEYAAQQADLWRNGLAQWGQSGNRIEMLRASTDFVIYTPGSDSGVPVSILQSFAAPALSWETEAELLRERVQGTVSAILGLVGMEVDPVRSREHILMANLFEHFWRKGEDLDFAKLILSIQNPPIGQLGVFDVDTFFPPKDRFELALKLNNILAAPSFQSWLQGQPLDILGFLSTSEGKTRHSIFYVAHLNDAERMFFVTILLNQLITWMRTQPGTTSLRALLYMDEIFGFFPPVANPPSKQPMLTLLKQARAFGVGVVLTTQNPVDLDYKGLTNTGTWFIGRLQTERDKMRLLDGLDSATSEAGQKLNRNEVSRLISGLRNRVFLLHNVHEEEPVVFHTRWAMSYLRGPLTRVQVQTLMGDRQPDMLPSAVVVERPVSPPVSGMEMVAAGQELSTSPRPLPPSIRQVFLPTRKGIAEVSSVIEKQEGAPVNVQSQNLIYEPAFLGIGRINFVDAQRSVNEQRSYALLVQAPVGAEVPRWEQAESHALEPRDLLDRPERNASFDKPPRSISEADQFNAAREDLINHLYRTSSVRLLYSPTLKEYSRPEESERDFQARLRQLSREKRDAEVDRLEQRYKSRLSRLGDRLRRTQASFEKRQADAQARKGEVMVSVGESILGMFMGRRSTRAASTAISKYRQSRTAGMSAEQEKENIDALQREMQELEQELREQADAITARWEEATTELESVGVTPRRTDIEVHVFALAWAPHWQIAYRDRSGSIRSETLPAY